jgi:hypothetical protein
MTTLADRVLKIPEVHVDHRGLETEMSCEHAPLSLSVVSTSSAGSGTTVSVKCFADSRAYFTVPETPNVKDPSKLTEAMTKDITDLLKSFDVGYKKIQDKYKLSSM